MPDQNAIAHATGSRDEAGAPDARKPFVAPAVENLGKLEALTQQFGGTI